MYNTPLMDLVYSAATVHRMYNDPTMVSSCSRLCMRHKSALQLTGRGRCTCIYRWDCDL